MASRSTKPVEPATAPVLAPDEAWLQHLVATKDAAGIAAQAKRMERAAREEAYMREVARLGAVYGAEALSLDQQIAQQERITASCDAAIELIVGGSGSNVVPLQQAAE